MVWCCALACPLTYPPLCTHGVYVPVWSMCMVDQYTYNLGRMGPRWREAQATVFRTQTHCWRCGRFVDQTLDPKDRMSRTVGHIVALYDGGAPYDLDNLRLEHRSCNSKAGRRMQDRMPRSETL